MPKSVVLTLILSLGVALGVTLAAIAPEPTELQSVEWLDNPRELDSFALKSQAGVFDKQSLAGHWTIVLFGFLHCPDICPTSLAQLAQLGDGLAAVTASDRVRLIFVSVDPERDSIAELGQYVRHFDPVMQGVTGHEDQLSRIAADLGIQFAVSENDDSYDVAHSTTYSIVDPDGLFRGRFRPGFDVAAVANSLAATMDRSAI